MAKKSAEVDILLNSKQAIDQLEMLRSKSKSLRLEMAEAHKLGDIDKYKELEKEFKQINKDIRDTKVLTADVETTLKNLNNAKPKDLIAAQRKLKRQMQELNQESSEYIKKAKQYRQVRERIDTINSSLRGQESLWSRIRRGINRNITTVVTFVAGITGAISALRSFMATHDDFEEAGSGVKALTGLDGKEFEYLKQQAKETSIETTEAGVRIKQSATEIMEAYGVMGSKRPELLANKEALAATTKDAIILSETTKKITLDQASNALATSLNQFNDEASESTRHINAIAAGSQKGAADVPYLTDALEKFGTTANRMGLKVENGIGVIEAIAPKFTDASLAGNSLDKVFLKMK